MEHTNEEKKQATDTSVFLQPNSTLPFCSGAIYSWPEGFHLPAEEPEPVVLEQWVKRVTDFSSQYGSHADWTAGNVTGPPRITHYGDRPDAWAPRNVGTPHEWLELGFETCVKVQTVRIFETLCGGAFCRLKLHHEGEYVTVLEQQPRCGQLPHEIRVEEIQVPDDQQLETSSIRLEFDQRGGIDWYEVDAVQLIGTVVPAWTKASKLDGPQQTLLNHIGELQKDSASADFTLVVQATDSGREKDLSFPVHRGILAARCPYFRKLLDNSGMPLSGSKTLEEVPPKLLELVLEWIYTGDLQELDRLDSVNLLVVADYFQIDDLVVHCTEVFKSVLTNENAAVLFAHFDSIGVISVKSLKEACCAFCAENFLKVSRAPGFEKLSQPQLLEIISQYRNMDTSD